MGDYAVNLGIESTQRLDAFGLRIFDDSSAQSGRLRLACRRTRTLSLGASLSAKNVLVECRLDGIAHPPRTGAATARTVHLLAPG
jgi:hypothetical protein